MSRVDVFYFVCAIGELAPVVSFFSFPFFFISKLRVSPFGGRRRCESSQMKLTPPTPLDQAKAEKPSLLAALFTGFLLGLNTHGYSASIFHVAGRLVSS